MLNRFYEFLQAVDDSFKFSFFASIATALLKPQETRIKTFIVFLATTIMGELIGKSIETIPFLEPFRYCFVISIGFYGKELYDWGALKMRNPVAFIREIRTGKNDTSSDKNPDIATGKASQEENEPSKH